MTNFEAFHRVISSSINLLFLKSEWLYLFCPETANGQICLDSSSFIQHTSINGFSNVCLHLVTENPICCSLGMYMKKK